MAGKILIPTLKENCLKNGCIAGVVIVVLFIAGMGKQTMDPLAEIRTVFIDKVSSVKDNQYIKIPDFNDFPGNVFFHVHQWSREVFSESFGPFDSERTIGYAFYPAVNDSEFDLVSRRYHVENYEIAIVESSLFMIVSIGGISGITNESDTLKLAALFCGRVFKLNRPMEFKWLPDHRVFSSAPNITYTQIGSWQNRIDAYIKGNGVEFLVYKEHISFLPHDDGSHWIPEEYKKAALHKRN